MTTRTFEKVCDVLNRMKWTRPENRLSRVTLVILDRVSGEKTIAGADILSIHRREFLMASMTIPNYKVLRIYLDGELIWERPR